MTIANNNVTKISVHKRNDRIKIKPKRWSHQDDLASLKGQKLNIETNDNILNGVTLLESDQFTLKVQLADERKSVRTYFKHCLANYEVAR